MSAHELNQPNQLNPQLLEYVDPHHPQRVADAEGALIGVAPEAATGLAISGGGIRSASFALGIMQALVNGKVMPHVHYLSTVSGGGYLGSSLTWFLNKGLPDGSRAGTSEDDFPFGTRQSSRVGPGARRNQILDYIRLHANYLVPSNSLGFLSFVAIVLRALLASLLVHFALLTAFMTVLEQLSNLVCGPAHGAAFCDAMPASFLHDTLPGAAGLRAVPNLFLLLSLLACGLFVGFSVLFSLATRFASHHAYALRTWVQRAFGWTLHAALACLLLGTLPLLYAWLDQWNMAATAGASSTLLGSLLGLLEHRKHQRSEPVE
jgi:hypothetical protein